MYEPFVIQTLSATSLLFSWEKQQFTCTRLPPAGDTPESRAAAQAEVDREEEPYLGKWMRTDGEQYVDFEKDGCVIGNRAGGQWTESTHRFEVTNLSGIGAYASCASQIGTYQLTGPNTLVLGLGLENAVFHRTGTNVATTERFTIPTSRGGVSVHDFRKDPGIYDQRSFWVEINKEFMINYYASDPGFLISLTTGPFDAVRRKAEAAFLKNLDISKPDACKLPVTVSISRSVDAQRAGINYPLSFCGR
ncbi:MAG: hypothetical protein ABSD63_10580 [Candidatus Korobacteraceae bacterium]